MGQYLLCDNNACHFDGAATQVFRCIGGQLRVLTQTSWGQEDTRQCLTVPVNGSQPRLSECTQIAEGWMYDDESGQLAHKSGLCMQSTGRLGSCSGGWTRLAFPVTIATETTTTATTTDTTSGAMQTSIVHADIRITESTSAAMGTDMPTTSTTSKPIRASVLIHPPVVLAEVIAAVMLLAAVAFFGRCCYLRRCGEKGSCGIPSEDGKSADSSHGMERGECDDGAEQAPLPPPDTLRPAPLLCASR